MEKTKQTTTSASHALAHEYKKELVARLTRGRTFSMMSWAVLNVLIAATQIGILVLAFWALGIVIDLADGDYVPYAVQITTIAVIILAFVITIISQIFVGLAKTGVYKTAAEKIQLETLQFVAKTGEYAAGEKAKLDAKATEIINNAMSMRKTVSVKLILLNILTRGGYEK